MRIISWNVNGLRAIYKRNFEKWLLETKADFICLQEIKAQVRQLPHDLIDVRGYFSFFNSGNRKGYAGVAVYAKKKPLEEKLAIGLGRFDDEGRILILEYPNFSLINLYLPHGGRKKENLDYKLEAYDYLFRYLNQLNSKRIILAGDFNIAHQEIDLARPKENANNIMFTPKERKQIDRLINMGFKDTFRSFNKERGNYTWWPYFAEARERNIGWRIDYIFVNKKLLPKVKKAFIFRDVTGSDHCPVGIEIK